MLCGPAFILAVVFCKQIAATGSKPQALSPVFTCPEFQQQATSDTASCDFSRNFRDQDNDPLYFSALGIPQGSGLTVNAQTGVLSGRPTQMDYDLSPISILVYASDSSTADFRRKTSSSLNWALVKLNERPSVVPNPPVYQCNDFTHNSNQAPRMASCDVAQQFSDPEGDTLFYSTTPIGQYGLAVDPGTGEVSGIPTEQAYAEGTIIFLAYATDKVGDAKRNSPALTASWTMHYPTSAPSRNPTPSPSASPSKTPTKRPTFAPEFKLLPVGTPPPQKCGDYFQYSVAPFYVNHASLENDYTLRVAPGSGLTIDRTTGHISGKINSNDVAASPEEVTVSNNGAETSFTLYAEGNDPVRLLNNEPIPQAEIMEGQFMEINLAQYIVSEGTDVTYTLAGSTSTSGGFEVTSGGLVLVRPDQTDVDNSPIRVKIEASNINPCGGGTLEIDLRFQVEDSNQAPYFTEFVKPTDIYCLGEKYQLNIGLMAVDPEGGRISFTIQGLPEQSGFYWDPLHDQLMGEVNLYDRENGPYEVIVIATDDQGKSTTMLFEMVFEEGRTIPYVDPPIPSPVTAITAERFFGYFNYHFKDRHDEPLIYSVHGLPAGTGMGIGPITGIFSGVPTEADLMHSPIPVSVFASNEMNQDVSYGVCKGHGGRARSDFLLVISPKMQAPICLPIPTTPRTAKAGKYFQYDVSRYFNDPMDGKLKFSLRNLPRRSGLTISELGTIVGTPTTADLAAAPMTILVEVENEFDKCASALYLMIAAPEKPQVSSGHYCAEFESIPDQMATEGHGFYLALSSFFKPLHSATLMYHTEGQPVGSGFFEDVNSGVFRGTPKYTDVLAGTDGMTLRTVVSCGGSATAISRTWTLTVKPEDQCADPCFNNGGCSHVCISNMLTCSSTCSCQNGFRLGSDGHSCHSEQVQPGGGACSVNNGGCDQICLNEGYSSRCKCAVGALQADGRTCSNACNLNNGGCDHICVLNNNQAECKCIDGELGPDGKSCVVNPCTYGNGGCSDTCNFYGNKLSCSCSSGVLSLDGRTCLESLITVGTIPPGLVLGCQYFMFDFSTAFKYRGQYESAVEYKLSGLPTGTGYTLSRSGFLQGTPTAADCNQPQPQKLMVKVSDGSVHAEAVMFISSYCEKLNICDQKVLAPSTRSANPIPVLQAKVCVAFRFNLAQYFRHVHDFPFFNIEGLPKDSGFQITPEGILEGVPSASDCRAGPLNVVVVATTGQGGMHKAQVQINFRDCKCQQGALALAPRAPKVPEVRPGHQMYVHLVAKFGKPFYYEMARHVPNAPDYFFTLSGLTMGTGFYINQNGILAGSVTTSDCTNGQLKAKVTARSIKGKGMLKMFVNFDVLCPTKDPVMMGQTSSSFRSAGPSVLGGLPPVVGFLDEVLYYDASHHFSSPSGDHLTYQVSGIPSSSGLSMTEDGVLMGVPTVEDANVHSVLVMARDSDGELATAPLELVIRSPCPEKSKSPVFISLEETLAVFENHEISWDLAERFFHHGLPDDIREFYVNGLPEGSGLTVSKGGVLSGVVKAVDVLADLVQLEVTEKSPHGDSVAVVPIKVHKIEDGPTDWHRTGIYHTDIVSMPFPAMEAQEGEPFVKGFTSLFLDADAHISSFIIQGLPKESGLHLDRKTGILSGTPNEADATAAQPLQLNVGAVDIWGQIVPETLELRITSNRVGKSVAPVKNSEGEAHFTSTHDDLVYIEKNGRLLAIPKVFYSNDDSDHGHGHGHDFSSYFPHTLGPFQVKYSMQGLPATSGLFWDGTHGVLSGSSHVTGSFTVQITAEYWMDNTKFSSFTQMAVLDLVGHATTTTSEAAQLVQSMPLPPLDVIPSQPLVTDISEKFSSEAVAFNVLGLPQGSGLAMMEQSGILFGVPSSADLTAKQPLALTIQAENVDGSKVQEVLFVTIIGSGKTSLQVERAGGKEFQHQSTKSCAQLGWSVDDSTCSHTPLVKGKCPGKVSHEAAQVLCTDIGARLCASPEIRRTSLSGDDKCASSTEQLWSTSQCAFEKSVKAKSVDGTSNCIDKKDNRLSFRCCADVHQVEEQGISRSTKSCKALKWRIPTVSKNTNVCVTEQLKGKGKKCMQKMSHAAAANKCAKLGARLCGSEELSMNVAAGGKCKVSRGRVWTSTSCGQGKFYTQGASLATLAKHPRECVSEETVLPFKCCADFRDDESFSSFTTEVRVSANQRPSASIGFQWPAYRTVRVSYKALGRKKWVTPSHTAVLVLDKEGRGAVELSNLKQGKYVARVTPIIGKKPLNKQSILQRFRIRKDA